MLYTCCIYVCCMYVLLYAVLWMVWRNGFAEYQSLNNKSINQSIIDKTLQLYLLSQCLKCHYT